ncbi:CD82 antigen isoform X3 [Canis lupus dingo]|uniref:CD82 antigen isoform X3 n=1 Tax=Canis lupus dingo TaxID=286419 RepID=UPI0020C4F2E5|nr:CD82 antigen isoform X3 [Canis lupus dingo]
MPGPVLTTFFPGASCGVLAKRTQLSRVCPAARLLGLVLRSHTRNHCSCPSPSLNRELQDRQDGVSLYQSHQVLSLPLQLALLYPGRGDPGFRGVDPGRQEQFHLCATDLLQLPQGGGLCLHRCGCRHHVHGLPGLHRCHQGGPLPAGAVLCLPPPHAHRPGGRWSPLLLQHRQAKARDGQHRDEAHPGLQGRPRGQTAGGLGLRAGSGEVLRLGQLLQLDGQCRAHEPHQCHLPLLLRG